MNPRFARFIFNAAFTLLAPEDDAGSGGGEETPTTPPPAADADARLAKMQESIDYNARVTQQFAEVLQKQGLARSQPPAEDTSGDDDYVDPGAQRLLNAQAKQHAQAMDVLQDRMDATAFRQLVQEKDLEERDVQAVESLYQAWRKQGGNVNGHPPTRADSLLVYLGDRGLKALEAKKRGRSTQEDDAPLRGATVSNRAPRVVSGKDPEKMSASERATNYWPEVLDKEGF